MITETFLSKLWEEYVNSLKARTSEERDSLTNHRSWTSHHHVEMFAVIGKINMTVRNLFNKLRKIRNDIVHKKRPVTRDEARGCLRVAIVIILNRLNSQDPFLNLEQNNLVTH